MSHSFVVFSSTKRRNYIEAKYVQKAFVRPLPSSNYLRPTTRSIRRWTIMKNAALSTSLGSDLDDENTAHLLKNYNRQQLFRFFLFCMKSPLKLTSYFRKPIMPSDNAIVAGMMAIYSQYFHLVSF